MRRTLPGPLPDAAHRLAASCHLDRNVVVIAGAGTGKTSLLVERALVTIGAGRVEIGRLVAITFTERAAAELRTRLAEGLEDLTVLAGERSATGRRDEAARALEHLLRGDAAPPMQPEQVARLARAALRDFEDAFAGTIHGFAAELLRRWPRQAGVDPYFFVDEGSGLRALHEQSWSRFLARELGSAAPREPLWRAVLDRFELEALKEIAFGLLSPVVPLDPGALDPGGAGEAWIRRDAASSAEALRPLERERLNPAPQEWIREAIAVLEAIAARGIGAPEIAGRPLEAWRDARDLGKKSGPAFSAEETKARMTRARTLLTNVCRVRMEDARLVLETLAPYAASVREAAQTGGLMSFDALLCAARDLLHRSEVLDAERERTGLLLVDEFQDTDPIQYDIVLSLAGKTGCHDEDPFHLPLEPGRLFIVGDPKQSIYRFRGADIAACDRAAQRILDAGGERAVLTSNFRSPGTVLEPLNILFDAAFAGDEPPAQPRYEPIHSRIMAEPSRIETEVSSSPAVTVLSFEPRPGETAVPARAREARAIAADMRALRASGVRWSEMALLLPAMSGVAAIYARPLRERGIPFVLEGGKAFGDKSEVRLMRALATAVARRSDAVAFLAVARSPLGAATDEELAAFAERRRFPPREVVDEREFPGIARADRLLRACRAQIAGLPVDEALLSLLEATSILPIAAVGWEGPQRVANLRRLVHSAARLAREQALSLEAAIEALAEEIERDDPGEAAISDEGLDAVKVLTVHRAKGLEFAHVFVADLRREMERNANPRFELRWLPSTGLAFPLRTREGSAVTLAEAIRRMEEPRYETAESIRTFYVACTRASVRLTLACSGPPQTGSWRRLLAPWGNAEAGALADGVLAGGAVAHRMARDSGTVEILPPEGAPIDWRGPVAAFDAARRTAAERVRRWRYSPSELPALMEAARQAAAGVPRLPFGAGVPVLAAAGAVVHSLLERWDRRDPGWFRAAAPAAVAREAAERGLDEGAIGQEVGDILTAFLGSGLPARLAGLTLIGREVPLFQPVATGGSRSLLLSGIADLVYREPDGTFVVADYKTDRPGSRGAKALVSHYGPQLSAYLAGLRAVRPASPTRAEVWLLRLGEILEVPDTKMDMQSLTNSPSEGI